MSNSETAMTKLIIKGAVAESNLTAPFERHLEDFRSQYKGVSAVSENEQAAFILALSYFATEIQE